MNGCVYGERGVIWLFFPLFVSGFSSTSPSLICMCVVFFHYCIDVSDNSIHTNPQARVVTLALSLW